MRALKKKRKANRLSDMTIDEISVVDRPANQWSKVVLFKADDGVYRQPDGRIDVTREIQEHGRGRLADLQELVRSGQLIEDISKHRPGSASRKRKKKFEPLIDDDWRKADLDDVLDHVVALEDDDTSNRELTKAMIKGEAETEALRDQFRQYGYRAYDSEYWGHSFASDIAREASAVSKADGAPPSCNDLQMLKKSVFGEMAVDAEAAVWSAIEDRAEEIRKSTSAVQEVGIGRYETRPITMEQAVAKAMQDPDMAQAYKAVTLIKHDEAALLAKAHTELGMGDLRRKRRGGSLDH